MTLLAIDGNSILNRAFYGIRMLTNSKGVPTNALFGFFNIYLKEAAQVQPEAVAVAFDLPAPTFRHKASADYKANRKGMPEDLARQLGPVKELLRGMGITVLVVTHEHELVHRFHRRVVTLKDGRIVSDIPADREAEPDLALPLDSLEKTGEITLETGKEALV